ncbi:MAG: beta-galactosidase [Pseudomonadota bacterium]
MSAKAALSRPTLGVCYYPEHWPREMWADDAARMVETGITHVRIAEFAWSRIETARDVFDFEWLDTAIETLAAAGLKIIMCTPTATPPKWLVDDMPDMVAVDHAGRPRGFGSRRHYDFSHAGYRAEAARITEIVAKRYGAHDAIVAWQTDNEYGCHDTTLSYSPAALSGFQDWLAQKYQSPDALNRAWGNVFWSMEVADFSEIVLPNLTVTEPNPSHVLDFRRYASDQVVAFNRIQTDILRKHLPGRDVVHNFMGRYTEFDHFDVSQDLDVASWDSYPLGFLEQFGKDDAWKNWYMRAGDPDFQAFHHDLYRACGSMRGSTPGRWWVMEQQPGPVNWAPFNPAPHPGMVRLWSHEAFAHGAEVVSYFRWRQAPFAQEQFHAALNRPDNTPDVALGEARQVADEIAALPAVQPQLARVALMFDYPSLWATQTQPQGMNFDSMELVLEFYSTLRQLGQSVDIVSVKHSLDGYDAIFVPQLLMVDEQTVERLKASDAQILFGPRCGSRTESHQIPDTLAPGALQTLIDIRAVRVESLRPRTGHRVGHEGSLHKWAEHLECGSDVVVDLERSDGQPAVVSQGRVSYLAGWPDANLMKHVIESVLEKAGIETVETGDDVRLRDNGSLRTIVNYGPKPRDVSHLIGKSDTILVGGKTLDIAGVAIVERG